MSEWCGRQFRHGPLTERVGVGAEGERVDDLVLFDVAGGLHVLGGLGEDEAARSQQHHTSCLRLSAARERRETSEYGIPVIYYP